MKFNTTYRNPVFFEAPFSFLHIMKSPAFNNMTNEIGMIQYIHGHRKRWTGIETAIT